jgi:hypothetical protein
MAGFKEQDTDTPSVNHAAKPEDKKLVTMKEAGRNMKHGLYCDPNKVKIDGRSFFGKMRKSIKTRFLEGFKGTPSALAQTLAEGAATHLIMAMNFQAAFLRGDQIPHSILRDYTGLWNSISRDLQTLSQMAKESGAKDSSPDLQEYVEAVKSGKLVLVEAEPADKPASVTTPQAKGLF